MLDKIQRRIETANALQSAHQIDDLVHVDLQGIPLNAKVMAVTFLEGKVLYTLALYTGHIDLDLSGEQCFINALGWENDGREYIRVANIDSIFVRPGPISITPSLVKQ